MRSRTQLSVALFAMTIGRKKHPNPHSNPNLVKKITEGRKGGEGTGGETRSSQISMLKVIGDPPPVRNVGHAAYILLDENIKMS